MPGAEARPGGGPGGQCCDRLSALAPAVSQSVLVLHTCTGTAVPAASLTCPAGGSAGGLSAFWHAQVAMGYGQCTLLAQASTHRLLVVVYCRCLPGPWLRHNNLLRILRGPG